MRSVHQQEMEIVRTHRAIANGLIVIAAWITISNFSCVSAKPPLAETAAEQQPQVVRYSNTWAVEVRGGAEEADALAQKHGLINRGQIGNQQYHYLFMEGETARMVTKDLTDIMHMATKTAALKIEQKVGSVTQQKIVGKVKREYTPPSDPGWSRQWSLENMLGPLDLNVEPVWMQGITGDGVVVGIVDDGMDWQHNDLTENYDSFASYDFAHYDHDPTPDYNSQAPNTHGTECAGVVGMSSNSICGIGVAHQANIGSLKFDIGGATDAQEASALGYHDYHIDVYSNSWGPSDFGFVVRGPGPLVRNTLRTGVTEGRGGKGNVYVWASGNGGQYFDSCAADGFISSIYSIGVGSADERGRQAYYDEDCSAKMAVTFSYNSHTLLGQYDPFNQVYATTLNNQCTDDFTGTSASAPLVSGVVALTLQANSNLTWRDVQYLVAYTSNPDILTGDDWVTNGGGLSVSHHFGFGAIDAEAMVTRARQWTNVPEQHTKTFSPTSSSGSVYSILTRTFVITENAFSMSDQISSLEHVIVTSSLSIRGVSNSAEYDYDDLSDYEGDIYDWLEDSHPRRGDIKIELTSPQGTKSILLPYRRYDFINEEGYDDWPFMSVHFWGENPIGNWTLRITYKSGSGYVWMSGLSMTLHGTATIPTSVSSIPSVCHSSCARGCFGEGPEHCDSCQHFRIASTLECVDQCPSHTHAYQSYCYPNQGPTTANSTVIPTDPDKLQSTISPTTTPTISNNAHSTTSSTVTPTSFHEGHSTTSPTVTATNFNEEHSTTGPTVTPTSSNERHSTAGLNATPTNSPIATPTSSEKGSIATTSSTILTPTHSDEETSTSSPTASPTDSDDRPTTTSSTATGEGRSATNTKHSNTVPIAIGVTTGIIILAAVVILIISVIIFLVYSRRRRKVRSNGFIQLLPTEVET